MEDYVQIFCAGCNENYLTINSNLTGKHQHDYLECWVCKKPTTVIPHEKITDPLLFFKGLDDELENANYHDRIGLGKNLWKVVQEYIPKDKHIEVAKELCNKLRNI